VANARHSCLRPPGSNRTPSGREFLNLANWGGIAPALTLGTSLYDLGSNVMGAVAPPAAPGGRSRSLRGRVARTGTG